MTCPRCARPADGPLVVAGGAYVCAACAHCNRAPESETGARPIAAVETVSGPPAHAPLEQQRREQALGLWW
jgi:hypothetical protein